MKIAAFRHAAAPGHEPFIGRQLRGLGPELRLFTVMPSDLPGIDVWSLEKHSRFGRAGVVAFQLTRRSPTMLHAMRDYRARLVLAHFAQDAWRIEHIARTVGVPLVAVVHGSDALVSDEAAGSTLGLSARQLRGHWRDLAASASLFLPVSDHVGDRLRDRGVPDAKIVRHYLGVEVPRLSSGGSEAAYDVGFVGRLEPNKGAVGMVRALAGHLDLFFGLGRELRVLVVGDGTERGALEELARAWKGRGLRLDLPGRVEPGLVSEMMASCSVVCCPSIQLESGIGEGLGLTSLEAQAVARPVVAFATGGLGETILDGTSGILVGAGDWTGLASSIAALVSDPVRARAMGAAGRRWVENEWDVASRNRALLGLLGERFS